MSDWVSTALSYAEDSGIRKAIFILPFEADVADIDKLLSHPRCTGVVVRSLDSGRMANHTTPRIGYYADDGLSWIVPAGRGTLIFLGTHLMLTGKMLTQVVRSGQLSIVCRSSAGLRRVPLYKFLLWRIGDRTVRSLTALPRDHAVTRLVVAVRSLPFFVALWRRVFKRPSPLAAARRGAGAKELDVTYFRELLRRARSAAQRCSAPIPRRVVLVNAGLAAGGAERQIVNTLSGLRDRNLESVAFLGEYLHAVPGLDFYLPSAQNAGAEVSQVRTSFTLEEHGLASLPPDLAEMVAALPPRTVEEIMNLAEELRLRRPEVVHAWQDTTSIKGGIAAVICGVPRIVLVSRNVNPTNFEYFQDYMRPAYLALAELDNVILANNSDAGAADYCAWLGLPRERYHVIRNGVDLSGLRRAAPGRAAAWRASIGVPADALVIGSVFRFWPEKRPLLWLQTAAAVHRALPEVHFVLAGEGPLRPEMERFVTQAKLAPWVHLPGAAPDVALPISVMDLFLLTSEFEGTPNVVLEAQWLGVPVVATDSGGTSETVDHGRTGWITDTADADSIARLVVERLGDDRALQVAAAEGPHFVERRFGVARMIDETMALYGYS